MEVAWISGALVMEKMEAVAMVVAPALPLQERLLLVLVPSSQVASKIDSVSPNQEIAHRPD